MDEIDCQLLNDIELLNSIKKTKQIKVKYDKDSVIERCTSCSSIKIVELEGRYVCQECGIENNLVIDCGQEWRYYGSDDTKGSDPSRCGMPTNELLPNSSIGSSVGFSNGDSRSMAKIRNMNNWYNIPYRESSLLESFNNITILCENAGINSIIIEEAKIMYKEVSEVKHSRRIKKEAMKAASVFLACELKNVSRSIKEIANIFNIKDTKVMSRSIKNFEEIWQSINTKKMIESIQNNEDIDKNESSDSNNHELSIEEQIMMELNNSNVNDNDFESLNYLHRHCSKLNITDKVYNICKELLIYIEQNNILETHNPLSRVSSVIFYMSNILNLSINKLSITKVCNISEVTINKCYNKLLKINKELNDIIERYD
jgi:transcription initiation factor TFIIIB Brf1 subunit/transcription initiation factor TFIIB